LRANLRLRHYSPRTEEAYVSWVRRFVRFHGLRHPGELGEREVVSFLTHLTVERGVASSTQAQALAALLFLYRDVLGRPLEGLGAIPRARAPVRLPVVLTRQEVQRVLAGLEGTVAMIGALLYGSGMRLMECLTLRVKDLDLDRGEFRIRRAKGAKDRVTVLARSAGPRWSGTWIGSARRMRGTWRREPGGSSCPMPWAGSTRMPGDCGRGSGCFRRGGGTWTE
jgi:integrase